MYSSVQVDAKMHPSSVETTEQTPSKNQLASFYPCESGLWILLKQNSV